MVAEADVVYVVEAGNVQRSAQCAEQRPSSAKKPGPAIGHATERKGIEKEGDPDCPNALHAPSVHVHVQLKSRPS